MSSGKISGLRTVMGFSPVGSTAIKPEKDGQKNPQDNPQKESQKRQPTEEEAQRALSVLASMDSVVKNGLKVELVNEEGIFILFVRDSNGQVLRGLRGPDIFRLLDTKVDKSSVSTRGSILDSRM